VFEFDGRIFSSKPPIDGDLLLIAPTGPGSDVPTSYLEGGQPLRQALAIQDRKFNLSHIEPTGMFRCVIRVLGNQPFLPM
jgi:hypothetical protein